MSTLSNDLMETKAAHMRELAIFDMVTEYLHTRELYDAEALLKKQRRRVLELVESPQSRCVPTAF